MSQQETQVPQSLDQVGPVVEPHLDRFAQVLAQSWEAFVAVRDGAAAQMAFAGPSSRGMLVSDFTREPAHRIFADTSGAVVDDRFGRPWVNLAGGLVQVRFRKLAPNLTICPTDSARGLSLAYHLGDPYLPGMPEATILTAGYVLDSAELSVAQMALVCHLGTHVHYALSLPGAADTGPAATPLTLAPLSVPIIRSARTAAEKRLAERNTAADE